MVYFQNKHFESSQKLLKKRDVKKSKIEILLCFIIIY